MDRGRGLERTMTRNITQIGHIVLSNTFDVWNKKNYGVKQDNNDHRYSYNLSMLDINTVNSGSSERENKIIDEFDILNVDNTTFTNVGCSGTSTTPSNITESLFNSSSFEEYVEEEGEWSIGVLVVMGVTLYTLALCTAVGNILVIHAIRTEKRLQTVSNLFIMSLAAADLIVGLTVMPVSAAYAMMGDWQLGLVVCQLWLGVDYTASTASIFNLVILSLDRYWSITMPLRYLRRRTRRRAWVMIGGSWACAAAWLAPVLLWHLVVEGGIRHQPPHVCDTEFSSNVGFKTITSLLNFYLPTSLMIFLYIKIYSEIRSRQALGRVSFNTETDSVSDYKDTTRKSRPVKKLSVQPDLPKLIDIERCQYKTLTVVSPGSHGCSHYTDITVSVEYVPDGADKDVNGCSQSKKQKVCQQSSDKSALDSSSDGCSNTGRVASHQNHIHCYQSSSRPNPSWNSESTTIKTTTLTTANSKPSAFKGRDKWRGAVRDLRERGEVQTSNNYLNVNNNNNKKKRSAVGRSENVNLAKERKAAKQLGVIVGAFLACWVPYFTLFPVMAVCDTCIPASIHTATIWLGYLNSTLNPVLYPLCNHNFRRAFARTLGFSKPRNPYTYAPARVATITLRQNI
ncbi:unnamed protein product [Meganyctiphanes norvegica]|uniref:Histamine H1 receptor n=1 Tax=Meganyctiphanes norvegica TaxID=48144 RepID=A0AAV2RWE6_MEGNR